MSSTNFADGRNTGFFSRKSIHSLNHTHAPQLNSIGSINRLDNLIEDNDSDEGEEIVEEEFKYRTPHEEKHKYTSHFRKDKADNFKFG